MMLGRISRMLEKPRILLKAKLTKRLVPTLTISEIRCYEDYTRHVQNCRENILANRLFEKNLVPDNCTEFTFNGYCYLCRTYVDFLVNFAYSYEVDGVLTPNWREHLACPRCHLNNRMRAVLQIFDQVCQPNRKSRIYTAEQMTDVYRFLKLWFPYTLGSEYLGNSVDHGTCDSKGIRNEDLTQLSFANNQFDYILTLDVFEHIPNYQRALAECCRCLRPGGMLFFSVPFNEQAEKNIARAYVSDNGEVIHLLPPEYHGDLLCPEGCLCFNVFGWEILNEINAIGFKDAKALFYWSRELGYLGGEQVLFVATKRTQHDKA